MGFGFGFVAHAEARVQHDEVPVARRLRVRGGGEHERGGAPQEAAVRAVPVQRLAGRQRAHALGHEEDGGQQRDLRLRDAELVHDGLEHDRRHHVGHSRAEEEEDPRDGELRRDAAVREEEEEEPAHRAPVPLGRPAHVQAAGAPQLAVSTSGQAGASAVLVSFITTNVLALV